MNHIGEEKVNKGKRKKSLVDVKQDKKRQRACYHCHKKGHYIKNCQLLKNGNNSKEASCSKANLVKEKDLVAMITTGVQCMHLGMIIELNMATQGRSLEWRLESSAIVHVCNDYNQFEIYEEVNNRELLMGTVELNFTSGKKLGLVNVLYVTHLRKNLVSTSLLCKRAFKTVIEFNKMILLKNEIYLGKRYCSKCMLKLSINNKGNVFVYIVDSCDL